MMTTTDKSDRDLHKEIERLLKNSHGVPLHGRTIYAVLERVKLLEQRLQQLGQMVLDQLHAVNERLTRMEERLQRQSWDHPDDDEAPPADGSDDDATDRTARHHVRGHKVRNSRKSRKVYLSP